MFNTWKSSLDRLSEEHLPWRGDINFRHLSTHTFVKFDIQNKYVKPKSTTVQVQPRKE